MHLTLIRHHNIPFTYFKNKFKIVVDKAYSEGDALKIGYACVSSNRQNLDHQL